MSNAQISWFSGRVWKRSLPVFNGPPPVSAPSLKRLLLPQGELAQLHDSDEGMRYLAFIELKEGCVRGNHLHKVKREYVYILDGESVLDLIECQSGEGATVPMGTGDLAFISPGIAHALTVVRNGHAVEFSPDRFDAGDIHRYAVVG